MIPNPRRALITLLAALAPATLCAQPVPMEYQYLYGSGEAAAQSIATLRQLTDYAHAAAARRKRGAPLQQAVLTAGTELEAPRFAPCGRKPLAVVFDIDETLLLNLGFERWLALGLRPADVSVGKAWDQWDPERPVSRPGMQIAAIGIARTEGAAVAPKCGRSDFNSRASVSQKPDVSSHKMPLGACRLEAPTAIAPFPTPDRIHQGAALR